MIKESLKKDLIRHLEEINKILIQETQLDNTVTINNSNYFQEGLLSGRAGILYYLSQVFPESTPDNVPFLDKSFKNLLNNPSLHYDFTTGLSGLLYVHYNSNYQNYYNISEDTRYTFDKKLSEVSNFYLQSNNWDFLYGSIGLSLYMFDYESDFSLKTISDLLSYFENTATVFRNNEATWYSQMYPNISNFGLAHGIPSILHFLLLCLRKGIKTDSCASLLSKGITHIKNWKFKTANSRECIFPALVDVQKKDCTPSRLAWCYGDLSIAYLLYNIGESLNDSALVSDAIEIVDSSLNRLTFEHTWVEDACMCHGACGVAYLYYKFYLCTNNLSYLKQSEYWLEVSMKYLTRDTTGKIEYLFFNRHFKEWIKDTNLLEGLTGVAFCYSTILGFSNTKWDRCLLLS